jgi:uncharacterized protein (TIGR00251 family)
MVRITVRAKPRARRSSIVRAAGLSVEVALAAPPVDGAANDELLSVLAEALAVPRSALRLVLGAGSKNKVVEVVGPSEADVAGRLAASAGPGRKA